MGRQMATAIRKATAGSHIQPCDHAAVTLALMYARRIDDGGDLNKLGPPLLAVLESLRMTPRARAVSAKGGGRDGKRGNPLDELRARRAARVDNPAAVDSTAP